MTENDLVTGIASHPDELERWLILSDWLEDQGDQRAELARLRYLLQTEPEHPRHAERLALQQAFLDAVGRRSYRRGRTRWASVSR